MNNQNIVIVDYGMGNIGSIQNMFKYIGASANVSRDISQILSADKLILPGVGAFDNGMRQIANYNLLDVLNEKVLAQKTPILGVCLGMQLMTRRSEEGDLPGLGWIDAETIKFSFNDHSLKIPHMGWNYIRINKEHPLVNQLSEESRFYFVHSYYVKCHHDEDVLLTAEYGLDFDCGIQHDNLMGVQFHPEKSHKFGMQLFRNFVAYE